MKFEWKRPKRQRCLSRGSQTCEGLICESDELDHGTALAKGPSLANCQGIAGLGEEGPRRGVDHAGDRRQVKVVRQDFHGVEIKTGDLLSLRPIMSGKILMYRDLERGTGVVAIDGMCMVIAFANDHPYTYHDYALIINAEQMGWTYLPHYCKVG